MHVELKRSEQRVVPGLQPRLPAVRTDTELQAQTQPIQNGHLTAACLKTAATTIRNCCLKVCTQLKTVQHKVSLLQC